MQNIQTPSRESRQSQQMQMMSPRRLDAIRANGNNILSPNARKLNDKDAASSYKRQMENRNFDQGSRASRGLHNTDDASNFGGSQARYGSTLRGQARAAAEANAEAQNYEDMQAEITMNQQLHLVPCRWERSGWRYVQKDPADVGFFNNPNRVNNFGVVGSPGQKKMGSSSVRRDSFYNSKSAFAHNKTPTTTTYGRSFIKQRSPQAEASPWKQTQQAEVDQDGIQWAGESHKRQTFRKTKDQIGDWTNVLFRA